MGKKEELRILWGLVRRINNVVYGYKKPTGRRRNANKSKKNNMIKKVNKKINNLNNKESQR